MIVLVLSMIFAILQPTAVVVARNHCLGEGWRVDDFDLVRSQTSGLLFDSQAAIEFQGKGTQSSTSLRVKLYKPIYFLGWQVESVHEQVPAK